MASINKRGPYQWQARVRRNGWPTQIKTFETKGDAQAWARQMESEIDRGVWISRAEAENTTLEEALDRYKEEYIPSLAHSKREKNRINTIKKYDLVERNLASIMAKDINQYIKARQRKVKANTVRLELALLSRLFEVARSDWGMESLGNPVKRASKPRIPRGRERRLQSGELDLLLEHCSIELRPVIQFAIETAMRRTEIASLTWDNVDLNKRTAYLPETKNNTSRTVPLSPGAIQILKNLANEKVISLSRAVFNLSPDQITEKMRYACRKAGIKDLRFHDLRHEATSRFFENTDLDMGEIREITGHKSMQQLSKYTHLRSNRLADRLAGKKRGE